jgi:hypothetical protein
LRVDIGVGVEVIDHVLVIGGLAADRISFFELRDRVGPLLRLQILLRFVQGLGDFRAGLLRLVRRERGADTQRGGCENDNAGGERRQDALDLHEFAFA